MPDEFGGIEVGGNQDEFGGIAIQQPPTRGAAPSPESFEGQLAAQGLTPAAYNKAMAEVEQQTPKEPAPGLLGGLAKGFGHAFEATAKGPGVFTLSNEVLENELRKKQEEIAGRQPEGAAGRTGEFVGSLGGTLAQAVPIGLIGKKLGVPKLALAAMFASSGAYDAFIRAGLKALAEGKDYKDAVEIGKKTATVGALAQASVAAALPAGIPPSLGEALVSGIKPAAAGVAAVGAENLTQKALGLKTPVSEGMLPTALTMGLLPAGLKLSSMGYAKVFVPRSIQAMEETPKAPAETPAEPLPTAQAELPKYSQLGGEEPAQAKPTAAPTESPPAEPATAAPAPEPAPTSETPAEPTPPTAEPEAQALGITPNPAVTAALNTGWQKVIGLRDKLANAWAARPNKQIAAATKDAADTQSKLAGDQVSTGLKLMANRLFGNQANQALDAVLPMIESGGDREVLTRFIAQSTGVEGGLKPRQAAEFALNNYEPMQELANRFKGDMTAQINAEHAGGIDTEFREGYFPHVFDVDKLPNQGEAFFAGAGKGSGGRFKAARKFTGTIYDAVEAGYGKAIKSMNAADVAAGRVRSGMNKVMDSAWAESFRNIHDPTSNAPLITDVIVDRNGQRLPPKGYELVELFPGKTIAVHKGYSNFFDALTGRSKVEAFEALGLPVGQAVLKAEAAIKHGMLLFDTFHASRIIQKAVFLSPSKFGPQLSNIPQFARKGRALLEYSDRDLNEAVNQNEITPEIAAAVREARPTANLLISRGLNVGQVQEALRSDIIRNIRGIGTFNKWVFEKVTRGALMEGGLIEFERVKQANPAWSDTKVADKVAKDLNVYFGNLGRQGLFTSAGARDLARIFFLAPQWVESMARSEAYGAAQLLKAPFTGNLGTMAKGMATGLGAYLVGTQIINLITKGHPTWENEEEDHKLDAWIPDITGKTPGFWLSPLSVPAELTHDVIRYANKKEGAREVGMQMVRNKMSPLARAAWTMATGRNYADYKIGDTWQTAKEAALSLAPTPIPLAGTFKGYPGQTQRQLFGSAGLKIEPAETAMAQIRDKADRFRKSQPDAKPDEGHYDVYVESPYSNLRQALRSKNEKQVADAIEQLRKNRSDADIQKAMVRSVKTPLTGKRSLERPFYDTLSAKEQDLYDRAVEERLQNLDLFLKVWDERK